MNGFLNLLKPPGMSSGAAVACVKRLVGEKVGHAGTLDPEAAGVLPMMVGRGARLLNYFTDKSKRYIAEIAFAGATDTQDAQGTIVEPARGVPERAEIEAVLPRFRGAILQCPPAYSALKRDGVPLYALARRGEMVETKARPTTIDELTLCEQVSPDGYMLEVACAEGTYIRTLCHDIGQALGRPAHMRFLLRTRHGGFMLEDAVTFEELQRAAEKGETEKYLLPLAFPLSGMPALQVPPQYAKLARNGGKLPAALLPTLAQGEKCQLWLADTLLGVAHREDALLRFDVGLTGGE